MQTGSFGVGFLRGDLRLIAFVACVGKGDLPGLTARFLLRHLDLPTGCLGFDLARVDLHTIAFGLGLGGGKGDCLIAGSDQGILLRGDCTQTRSFCLDFLAGNLRLITLGAFSSEIQFGCLTARFEFADFDLPARGINFGGTCIEAAAVTFGGSTGNGSFSGFATCGGFSDANLLFNQIGELPNRDIAVAPGKRGVGTGQGFTCQIELQRRETGDLRVGLRDIV